MYVHTNVSIRMSVSLSVINHAMLCDIHPDTPTSRGIRTSRGIHYIT